MQGGRFQPPGVQGKKKKQKQPGSVRLASLVGSSGLTGPFSETESQRFEGS